MTYAETSQHAHYVTVRFDSRRWATLAGPFRYHRDAERHVENARRAVQALVAGTARQSDFTFAGYGTSRLCFKPGAPHPPGRVNASIGLHIDPGTGYVPAP